MKFFFNIILFVFASALCYAQKDDYVLKSKRNNIELKIGTLNTLVKNEKLHFYHQKQYADDLHYDLDVFYKNHYLLPFADLNYNLRVSSEKRKDWISYLTLGAGYSSLVNQTVQKGIYYGGYALYIFNGTIHHEQQYNFINVNLGYSLNKVIQRRSLFTLSVFIVPKINFSTWETYTEENTLFYVYNGVVYPQSSIGNRQEKVHYYNNNFFRKIKYYEGHPYNPIWEFNLTAAYTIDLKKIRCGVFVGYTFSNYSSNKDKTYFIFGYKFLQNYNLIKYGLTLNIPN
ncbi:MAG: hypothetical protein KF900_09565 [Bacteroidetes bacterium]|nr:hypothetical protein [Bacteroidota bacterium]